LSEVAYQLADTNSGDRTVIAKDIVKLNADVATAFGVFLNGVDNTLLTLPLMEVLPAATLTPL
jgi:hypothetical protein